MTRPLKVGEYRKVKTWAELLATEETYIDRYGNVCIGNFYYPKEDGKEFLGNIYEITEHKNRFELQHEMDFGIVFDWFFTDDYYDENGNEVKMEEDMEEIKVDGLFKYIGKTSDRFINGDTYPLKRYNKDDVYSITMFDLLGHKHTMRESYFRETFEIVKLDQWVNDIDPLDTLDQLEATTKQDIANSNKVLDQIALMREIDLKQVEIDQLIEAQNKRIEEYEKGATE